MKTVVSTLITVLLATPVVAAEPLADAQLDRVTAGGLHLVDTPGRLDVAAHPGPANIGIFINFPPPLESGTLIDTPGHLDIVEHPEPAWIVISVK